MVTSIFSLLFINLSFSLFNSVIFFFVSSKRFFKTIVNSSHSTIFVSCSVISFVSVITSYSLDFFFLENSLYNSLATPSFNSNISKPISLVKTLPDSDVVKPIKSSRFFSVAKTNNSKSFSLPIVSLNLTVVLLASSSFNSCSSPSGNNL